MEYARYFTLSAVLNGNIIVAGGCGGRDYHESLVSVESYDPVCDKWTQLAPMKLPRGDYALVQSKGFLYAMGHNRTAERFDPNRNFWSRV